MMSINFFVSIQTILTKIVWDDILAIFLNSKTRLCSSWPSFYVHKLKEYKATVILFYVKEVCRAYGTCWSSLGVHVLYIYIYRRNIKFLLM